MQEPEQAARADVSSDIYLSVRWAWRMSDCFDPEQLEPGVKYDPQQLFWQRNECADGVSYVQGDLRTPLSSAFTAAMHSFFFFFILMGLECPSSHWQRLKEPGMRCPPC